jgi:hypothetical protein
MSLRILIYGISVAASVVLASQGAGAQAQAMDPAKHRHPAAAASNDRSPRVDSLLAITRDAAAPFRDRSAAITAGYRRIGPDVPSMGEHWISPRLVVADSFDIAQPALLTYIHVDGKPTLTGVVFARPLAPGELPPEIFGPAAHWHEHNGTLDEEALLPDHHSAPSSATGTRLAILHAWLWSPNPAGMFGTDNWTIPFLRLGLIPPSEFPVAAARALSLVSGAEQHFLNLAGAGASDAVMPLVRKCAAAAKEISDRSRGAGGPVSPEDLQRLTLEWTTMVAEVSRVAGKDAARRMNGGVDP